MSTVSGNSATLPSAEYQEPACGCCGGNTDTVDSDWYSCEDCGLYFNAHDGLSASFADDSIPVCGFACDNSWHGDHKIRQGQGFDCGTCLLPSGHRSLHWTGCVAVVLGVL